jgi:hypothetical protein
MEPGFVIDRAHANSPTLSEWVQGHPEKGWLGLKLRGKLRLPVMTYRCDRCGLLQSVARGG